MKGSKFFSALFGILGILMIVVVLNFLLNRLTKGEFSI